VTTDGMLRVGEWAALIRAIPIVGPIIRGISVCFVWIWRYVFGERQPAPGVA